MLTAEESSVIRGTERPQPVWRLVDAWLIVLAFIFFATHGDFSFQHAATSGSSLSDLSYTGRNLGVWGSLILPGVAYSIVIWCVVRNGRSIKEIVAQMKLVSLLALLTILSALWSQEPTRSAVFGALYSLGTLFAFYLVVRFDSEKLRMIVMLSGVSIAVLNLAMVVFPPHFGVSQITRDAGAWRGIFSDRTSCAKCFAFLLSPAITCVGRSWSIGSVVYIMLIALMILKAHAVTALIALLVYLVVTLCLRLLTRLESRAFVIVAAGMAGTALLVICVGVPLLPDLLALFGRDLTLTGRTEVWSAVFQSILRRPFLGYGFYAFWLGLKGESANIAVTTHWIFGYAHNGILEVWLQLGLVGLTVFLLTFVQASKNAWLCVKGGRVADVDWYIGLLILTILYNLDEATVVFPNELLSIFYIVACCGLMKAAAKSTGRTTRGLVVNERDISLTRRV